MLRRPLGSGDEAVPDVSLPSDADEYEWRAFANTAHLYLSARLADEYAATVVPWCERVRAWPLGHDQGEVGRTRLDARHLRGTGRCADCGHLQREAHMIARQRARDGSQ